MKLSDYVFDFIAKELGVGHVFGIVGGANSHLADSLVKNPRLKLICTQHEQGAAMAAEGYARASGKIGVVLVTSGPGGTNVLTGVSSAWCDSIPCLFISGQLPLDLTTDGTTIRQLGVQHINIVKIVESVTKYAEMITSPYEIRYALEKAVYLATHDRPGPVWLDIPTDIQRAEINPEQLRSFNPLIGQKANGLLVDLDRKVIEVKRMIAESRRPVLVAGHGIRLAKAEKEFLAIADRLQFPVITTWNGIDLINHDHPLYIGCAGVMGQRAGNFAVANADLILSIGSRMDTRQVGNNPRLYGRAAKKIVVDIDIHELNKGLIKIDLPVEADAKKFIIALLSGLSKDDTPNISAWLAKCWQWKKKYSVIPNSFSLEKDKINSYVFIDKLCDWLGRNDIVVTDMGSSLTCTMQTFKVGGSQRLFTNTGFAPMGFGLPGAIGAWFGGDGKRIIGIFGDGGFQMNIQELQTVVHYKIPIKIFILNNHSYLTIKHTQEFFFNGVYAGAEPSSGYSAPEFHKIANAYGIPSSMIEYPSGLSQKVRMALMSGTSPFLCEIMMDENQELVPISILDKSKGYVGSPVERMYPFLPEEEFKENMIIDPA